MKRLMLAIFLVFPLVVSAAPMGILVASYFDPPGTDWNGLIWAASRVPLIAIANPYDGPGPQQYPYYVTGINNLRAAGAKVIGYVYTKYATLDTNTVCKDIDNFFAFYTIDGIFLDTMTSDNDTNHFNYYAGLYQYIQTKGTNLLVVGNPGTTTQEAYLTRPGADLVMTFESDTGYSNYVADAWVTNHLARQFCHLPYAITNVSTMTNFVNFAASRNAGWIYITDGGGANPYGTLPSYWTNEVEYVRSLNLAQPATQLKVLTVSNRVTSLQITGAAGVYELQASTNLANWSVVTTANTATSTLLLKDADATNYARRFYRTRQ